MVIGALAWLLVAGEGGPAACAGLALLLGGATGNVTDRIIHGAVTDFLEISPFQSIQPKDEHSLPYTSPMTQAERSHLREIFAGEVRELERTLGWDCRRWLGDR